MKKRYLTTRHPVTGKRVALHRHVAEELLGRSLLPGEIVHHIDGDSTNNEPENLLVLPSQAYHAHIEWVLKRERAGQAMLFPEVNDQVRVNRRGTLFEFVVAEGSSKGAAYQSLGPLSRFGGNTPPSIPPGFVVPGKTYRRLSEQVKELAHPQRSDTFVKLFRAAARTGRIRAISLPGERFLLPKRFHYRGKVGGYQKDTGEMLFEWTPEFEAWLGDVTHELALKPRRRAKPSLETVEAGLVDFEALARETQARMQDKYERQQARRT